MKKSILKILRNSIVCVFLCSSASGFCDDVQKQQPIIKKIYIALDQLWIDESGIFVNFDQDIQSISAVFRDEGGLYIRTEDLVRENSQSQYQCPNGHPSRHGDGRCNQPDCPYSRNK